MTIPALTHQYTCARIRMDQENVDAITLSRTDEAGDGESKGKGGGEWDTVLLLILSVLLVVLVLSRQHMKWMR